MLRVGNTRMLAGGGERHPGFLFPPPRTCVCVGVCVGVGVGVSVGACVVGTAPPLVATTLTRWGEIRNQMGTGLPHPSPPHPHTYSYEEVGGARNPTPWCRIKTFCFSRHPLEVMSGTPRLRTALPAAGPPGLGRPGLGQPSLGRPGLGRPGFGRPVSGRPGLGRPGLERPGLGRPGLGPA